MQLTQRLINFKAFKDTGPLQLSPITIFCGENSSGKSSILKSILLIKQSSAERRSRLIKDAPLQPLLFNGELTRLGSWSDTVHGKRREEPIRFEWTARGKLHELADDMDVRYRRYTMRAPNQEMVAALSVTFKSEVAKREELSTVLSCSTLRMTNTEVVVEHESSGNPPHQFYSLSIKLPSAVFRTTGVLAPNLNYYGVGGLFSILQESIGVLKTGEVRLDLSGPFISAIRPVLNVTWVPFFQTLVELVHASRSNVPGAKPKWHGRLEAAVRDFKLNAEANADPLGPDAKSQMLSGIAMSILHEVTVAHEQCRAALAPIWKRIRYLGPLRHQPQRFYQFDDTGGVDIGVSGEFTVQVLALEADNEITSSAIELSRDGTLSVEPSMRRTLLDTTNYWLTKMDLPTVTPDTLRQSLYELRVGELEVALPDVGFGVSQVLPIIVESLRATAGDTVILEQPEIHLHPRVQTALADFFLARALDGVKFIIESHSEYLIKRLCRRIAENTVPNVRELVNVTFVSQSRDGEAKCTAVEVNVFGEINNWPIGFFDSREDLYWTQATLRRRAAAAKVAQ